jgi:hypothetical protein
VTENLPEPPASAKTNRERVAAVTSAAQCAACHAAFITPAGFAFENYDAVGRFRTVDNGQPVNAADSYNFASGPKSFKDAVEFSRVLAESPEAHDCYARSWFTYLQGRLPKPEDEPFVKWLAERSRADRTSMRLLALTVWGARPSGCPCWTCSRPGARKPPVRPAASACSSWAATAWPRPTTTSSPISSGPAPRAP